MGFPTLIIDNFFDDPDKVVEYANTLEFSSSETGRWPGKRSSKLHEVNRELFNYICSKIYNMFYPFGVSKYQVSMSFQYIEPYSFDNKGWIHRDRNEFGGIVYLTKNPEVGTGTSIYKPTRGWFDSSVYVDIKKKYYINEKFDENRYNDVRKFHDDSFEETVRVENIYNRLFMFSGSNWHGVPNFGTKPRLTLVFFGHGTIDDIPPPLIRS
tara:strand:+ start:232 stop:864 length:633 start_codon:yes stop_codon:yes gene_type:complete